MKIRRTDADHAAKKYRARERDSRGRPLLRTTKTDLKWGKGEKTNLRKSRRSSLVKQRTKLGKPRDEKKSLIGFERLQKRR